MITLPYRSLDKSKSSPIPPLNGGTAGGITLDDVQFGAFHVAPNAIGQLFGHAGGGQAALFPGQLPGFLRRFPHPGGVDGFLQNRLGHRGIFLEIGRELIVEQGIDQGADGGVAQLCLGLSLELGVLQLDADNRRQPFPHVVAL